MLNKKFFILILFVFIVAMACVSAQDVSNGTIVSYESHNVNDLSISENIETADILNDGVNDKSADINCYQDDNFLIVSAVDNDGNNLTEGIFTFVSDDMDMFEADLNGESYVSFNLFEFEYDDFPQNVSISFLNDDYSANTTIPTSLENTIWGEDVVNQSSFSFSIFGNHYLPISDEYVYAVIESDEYYKEFYAYTENGYVSFEFALNPDNYTVFIINPVSSQRAYFDWNISKRNPSKESKINAAMDGYNLIIDLLDGLNNIINDKVSIYVNGTYYDSVYPMAYPAYYNFGVGESRIDLYFNDDFYYYSSNATLFVDIKDTIVVNDSFYNTTKISLQILDYNLNPVNNTAVNFYVGDSLYFNTTDENGYLTYDFNFLPGLYEIVILNSVCSQSKNVSFEVLEEYDYKKASINVVNDYYNFVINATDINGSIIDDGYITVIEENGSHNFQINNGTASFNYADFLEDFSEREVNLTFILNNPLYYPVNTTVAFKIIDTIISNDVIPGTVFNVTVLDMDKNPLDGVEVKFEILDRFHLWIFVENRTVLTDENGVASIEISDKYYDYTVLTENPFTHQTESNVWINKKPFNITPLADYVDESTGFLYVDGNLFSFVMPPNATGYLMIDEEDYVWEVEKEGGIAYIWLPELRRYDLNFVFWEDDYYMDAVFNYTVIACEMFNVTSEHIVVGDDAIVEIKLPINATGNVTADVAGENYTSDVIDGTATIHIPDLGVGNYTVPVTYSGDDKFNAITKYVDIVVEEDKSDIIAAPDVVKYFHGPERFIVNVTDYKGRALANKTVTICINGASYNRTTDANGTAGIALGLNSGVYNVTASLDNKTVNSVVTILTTVNGTDVVKVFRNATQYYATFLDSSGKCLANGTAVRFNINGVMYDRNVTGDEGLAKLNINLAQGEYVITAINPVTGENTANNITVLSKLTENTDITKYYRNETQYTVKVLDDAGNPVGANETVRFNINGVFYERQSNESGMVKLNLNLQPGDYIITAEYGGCMVSNNITILPVLNASDISMKYHDGTQFVANLVDGQGKPYAEQKIEFNINGVLYYRSTNNLGEAKLNINLMAGEYIITSAYNGAAISNTIKITA